MAGIFQSFRSSAMPKRLLRYAMARFDIFEDDALDLENLNLGFGLKNTFEFKDVGLKVDVSFCPTRPTTPPGGQNQSSNRIVVHRNSRNSLVCPLATE